MIPFDITGSIDMDCIIIEPRKSEKTKKIRKKLAKQGYKIMDAVPVILDSPKRMRFILQQLFNKPLIVSLTLLEYIRSSAQNRYYWGVLVRTVMAHYKETTGETITKEEVHAYNLQLMGVKIEHKIIFGKECLVIHGKSSSAMTKKEFSEMWDVLAKHYGEANEFMDAGCIIPSPKGFNLLNDYL